MSRLFKALAVAVIILLSGQSFAADANELGQLLDKIKTYDYGQSRSDLDKISDMICENHGKPEVKEIESRLDDFLKSDATYAAKDFVCRELSVAGTEASVPALASMLADVNYSDMARYALERIPAEAADKALRDALPEAKGDAKVGIINTLGVRGDKKAVGSLAELINDANETVAVAAVTAIGRIDDPFATEALAGAKDKTTGMLRMKALEAYLRCADRLAEKGQKEQASAIYKQLNAAEESMSIRVAATRGVIVTAGDKAGEEIAGAFKSGDAQIQTAAIEALKDVAKTDVIKTTAEQLPNLAAIQQLQLIAALADCGDKIALPAVMSAAKSTDDSVRIAALNAIGILGDASTVDMLVETAAGTVGDEQKAAQESLYRLRGADIDKAITDKLPKAEPKIKVELIRACDQRNISPAVPMLTKAATDGDGKARTESIKALRNLAGEGDIAGLIDLQIAATGADRTELEKTVVAVAHKFPESKNPAGNVINKLSQVNDLDTKCSLLSVLGRIGHPSGLPVLLEALKDKDDKIKDAAVRGLSEWPTAEPAGELLKVAKESDNQVHKILALRGYVKLAGLESDRPAEETINMYKEAMALAPQPAEKQMVLSGLANVKSFESLQMAAGYLEDEQLKQEAEAAIVKIAESTIKNHPQQTKELLQKMLAETTSDTVREQAQNLLNQEK